MPYFSYAKGDKKDEPRVSIRAKVCADAIEAAGADRLVTMNLHAPQIQGFFRIPVDDLYAMPVICQAVRKKNLKDLVVVSPDAGFAKMARSYASALNADMAIGDKERKGLGAGAKVQGIMGDVEGKTALVVDDFTISGGTLISVADQLLANGAKAVYAALTHGVFSREDAMRRLQDSPIREILITDTVESQPIEFCEKIKVVSVAPLFGEAIRGIHNRESISVLFAN
jgi:ribose-phosphate pyrophosphokinase